ncbi:MAG: AbrB family looped-hinge helix DNA binding protein [Rickettsiales bacterium]|jgi:AbrB family looped-hinge helix DNA binding protein
MRTEYNATISENGRIVIPAIIRKELDLGIGDELIISLSNDNDIILHSPKQSLQKLQNIFKSKHKNNLSDELINMRRKEEI